MLAHEAESGRDRDHTNAFRGTVQIASLTWVRQLGWLLQAPRELTDFGFGCMLRCSFLPPFSFPKNAFHNSPSGPVPGNGLDRPQIDRCFHAQLCLDLNLSASGTPWGAGGENRPLSDTVQIPQAPADHTSAGPKRNVLARRCSTSPAQSSTILICGCWRDSVE